MPQPPSEGRLREELTSYYRPLLPYWDRSLAGRGDLPFWRWLAGTRPGGRILELGAGSGRVTRVLAPAAGRVVALDLVPEALERARERLREAGNVLPVVADMRSFRLGARFDLVVAANDPFSHLRTDRGRDGALSRVAEHLAADGRFVLDALWFSDAWREEAAAPGGRSRESRVAPGGEADRQAGGRGDGAEALRVRQRWRCREGSRLCEAEFELHRGARRVAASTFRGRFWTTGEIRRRFRRAGLEVERSWGDYGRSEWSPSSDRLVVVARRT